MRTVGGPRAPDDQDHEWPACFVVDAADAAKAEAWGDRLARNYATRREQTFLSSSAQPRIDSTLEGVETLPVIVEGRDASDAEIGW